MFIAMIAAVLFARPAYCGATNHPSKGSEIDDAASTIVDAEPLKLRMPPGPVFALRRIALMRERIANGSAETATQEAALLEVAKELAGLPAEDWKDERNRLALVGFVLGGGNPTLLRNLAELRVFAESETLLAHGSLAYAEGHRAAAAKLLANVNVHDLPPSIGGQVALVKASLIADGDVAQAIALCAEARLISPGTLVEEAAMRLEIELATIGEDRGSFMRLVTRYARRFPRSVYLRAISGRIIAFAIVQELLGSEAGVAWAGQVAELLPQQVGLDLLRKLSETGLRLGKLKDAVVATRLAAKMSTGGTVPSWVAPFEGAAQSVSIEPHFGLNLLAKVETFEVDREIGSLIGAARILAQMIGAAPQLPEEVLAAEPTSQSVVDAQPSDLTQSNGGRVMAGVDVDGIAKRVSGKLKDVDQLLQEPAQ